MKAVGLCGSAMVGLQSWKLVDSGAVEADYLRTEGDILRHILYLCVMSAFLGLGAGS
ncbi:hypothetical protein D3C86_1770810 [compost metagenome]